MAICFWLTLTVMKGRKYTIHIYFEQQTKKEIYNEYVGIILKFVSNATLVVVIFSQLANFIHS